MQPKSYEALPSEARRNLLPLGLGLSFPLIISSLPLFLAVSVIAACWLLLFSLSFVFPLAGSGLTFLAAESGLTPVFADKTLTVDDECGTVSVTSIEVVVSPWAFSRLSNVNSSLPANTGTRDPRGLEAVWQGCPTSVCNPFCPRDRPGTRWVRCHHFSAHMTSVQSQSASSTVCAPSARCCC